MNCAMNPQIKDIDTQFVQGLLRKRDDTGHKGSFGHALMVCGSYGMAGAAMLTAEACLRSGVGKLTLHTPSCNREILQTSVPEAILHIDENERFVEKATLNSEYAAIGIGPGIGTEPGTGEALLDYLRCAHQPIVVDADGLNLLARNVEWQREIPADAILTPHPGEALRLVGSAQPEDVSAYATSHKIYVVLKGYQTHICTPTGEVMRLAFRNSGLSTAGSGDVLTGLVTGLLAQGYAPINAALLGVWLHGTAGAYAREAMDAHTMLARDIIRFLPQAFKKLESKN